jgi:hypothetical protein
MFGCTLIFFLRREAWCALRNRNSGGQGTTAIQTVTVTAAAPDANPTIQFDPTPELLAGGARSPRFPCTWCGAPHGGAYGPYCPSCNGKSKLPNGGVPPNPDPPDWDTDDDSPPAQADPDNGNQNWLIIGAGFLLLWLLLQDATA